MSRQTICLSSAKYQRRPALSADVADSYIKVSGGLTQLGTAECSELDRFLHVVSDIFEKVRVSWLTVGLS